MSDFDLHLPEQLQWFRRPPIWWDPVPDWFKVQPEIASQLLVTELRSQLEMMSIQARALEQKIALIEKAQG